MPLPASPQEVAQASLPYVTFQLDEYTLVACDLDGFELLRVPFRDELELNSREFMDTVAASVESLFPTAQPFWPDVHEHPGVFHLDQSAAIAAALQEMYEEKDRARRRQERQRARKDLKLARKLQVEEAMSGAQDGSDGLLVQNPAPWSRTPGRPTCRALPEGDYPALGPPVPKPKLPGCRSRTKLSRYSKEAKMQVEDCSNAECATQESSRVKGASQSVHRSSCPDNEFVIPKVGACMGGVSFVK